MCFHTDFRTIPHISVQSCFFRRLPYNLPFCGNVWKFCGNVRKYCSNSTVTFSPNNDLVIKNFEFELIIGYFELSKSQFKAFNLPQDIFQDKRSKFQVIKVEILTCKSQLSKCWVIKVKKMWNYNGRYYFETHINVQHHLVWYHI